MMPLLSTRHLQLPIPQAPTTFSLPENGCTTILSPMNLAVDVWTRSYYLDIRPGVLTLL